MNLLLPRRRHPLRGYPAPLPHCGFSSREAAPVGI
jgi:hypothetical protein